MHGRTGDRQDGSWYTVSACAPCYPRTLSIRRGRTVKVFAAPFRAASRTNVFLDCGETLIMKFPLLQTVLVVLAVTTILAGCSGSPSASPANPPDISVSMAPLLLEKPEIPFTVADMITTNPNLADPEFSEFKAKRGITRISSSEKTPSATSVLLGQTIIEYPPGNAAVAYARFVEMNRKTDQTRYKITWLPDPGIGNQSCALIVADRTGTDKPKAMIVFEKSTFMESVFMASAALDTDALTRSARAAAAKIP